MNYEAINKVCKYKLQLDTKQTTSLSFPDQRIILSFVEIIFIGQHLEYLIPN